MVVEPAAALALEPLPKRGLILISGPSRGGKSAWAEHLAQTWPGGVAYLATGPTAAGDPNWSERVLAHQRRRPPHWQCHEVGEILVEQLHAHTAEPTGAEDADSIPTLLLIDSLGTWVAWYLEDTPEQWQERCDELLEALAKQPAPVLIVVEETGWGVVPATAIGGLFRDRLGTLQQDLMRECHTAWLVVAGRALNLNRLAHPVPPPSR